MNDQSYAPHGLIFYLLSDRNPHLFKVFGYVMDKLLAVNAMNKSIASLGIAESMGGPEHIALPGLNFRPWDYVINGPKKRMLVAYYGLRDR